MARHFTQLDDLTTPYGHIVLAPHLDDAALACGGMLAGFAATSEPVLVVNICSGSPASDTAFSPFAASLHAVWGLPPDAVVQRRLAEDELALETLGADAYQLDLLDAIYRMPTAYGSEAGLFGALAPDDSLVQAMQPRLTALAARFPEAIFYAPLGIGHHVDHQATHTAAATLARAGVSVAYYEDFPYVLQTNALMVRLAELGGAARFLPVVTAIDAVLTRKIGAIEAYQSQIGPLFGDAATLARLVTAYAESLRPESGTYGERLWVPR